jgi:hypothetical protein
MNCKICGIKNFQTNCLISSIINFIRLYVPIAAASIVMHFSKISLSMNNTLLIKATLINLHDVYAQSYNHAPSANTMQCTTQLQSQVLTKLSLYNSYIIIIHSVYFDILWQNEFTQSSRRKRSFWRWSRGFPLSIMSSLSPSAMAMGSLCITLIKYFSSSSVKKAIPRNCTLFDDFTLYHSVPPLPVLNFLLSCFFTASVHQVWTQEWWWSAWP